jgi:hypothetical protein
MNRNDAAGGKFNNLRSAIGPCGKWVVGFGRLPSPAELYARAREAEPSAAANPARALGRAAGDFFLTDWLAAVAASRCAAWSASPAATHSAPGLP